MYFPGTSIPRWSSYSGVTVLDASALRTAARLVGNLAAAQMRSVLGRGPTPDPIQRLPTLKADGRIERDAVGGAVVVEVAEASGVMRSSAPQEAAFLRHV